MTHIRSIGSRAFTVWCIGLALVCNAIQIETALAQDNRFLVTRDFVANYSHRCHPSGCQHRGTGTIQISFYIENVSDGGISILLTSRQADAFIVNHSRTAKCLDQSFGGLPVIDNGASIDQARRAAVYIPNGSGFYATVTKSNCEAVEFGLLPNQQIRNGIVSGNVTVIKGRRILTRPISGRF